jgi:hypothetical protein
VSTPSEPPPVSLFVATVAHNAISHFSRLLGTDAAAVYELRETVDLDDTAIGALDALRRPGTP